jgi:two-component system OmpR family response regulator
MVVEDDVTMRQLVTNHLEENSIRAISASGREDVLGSPARHRPDLVVLSIFALDTGMV